LTDVAHQLSPEIVYRSEDALRHDVALDLGEPQLGLVQLRPVRRGEVQRYVRMRDQERFDHLGLVGREPVGDDVDFLARQLLGNDVGEAGDEPGRRMTRRSPAQRLVGSGVEGRVQGQAAVPVALEPAALGTSARQRQHGVLVVQRLDGCLLVDAERRRVLRRVEIQADHIRRCNRAWREYRPRSGLGPAAGSANRFTPGRLAHSLHRLVAAVPRVRSSSGSSRPQRQ
jgi:hypothetical protein